MILFQSSLTEEAMAENERTIYVILYVNSKKKPEVAEANDHLAVSFEHHITIDQPEKLSRIKNISKIVRKKSLLTLQEVGGLGGVVDAIGTDLEKGISDQEALHRQQELSLSLAHTRTFFHLVWEEVKSKTVLLLFLAVALSIVIGINEGGLHDGWTDGVLVLIAIILQVFFASIRKYRKEQRARKKLLKQQSKEGSVWEFRVIRGGETKDIGESELVCGDLVLLKKGCQVPADGLFVKGEDLELDYGSESYITNEHNPFLSYGERVINGDAWMVVTSTYMMMSKGTCDPNTRFKLATHLNKLNTCMHYTQIVISFLIVLVLFLRYKAGKIDDVNIYRPESMAKPANIRSFSHTLRKIIKESKDSTKGLTKLLSLSLVGLTEGVPFVVSLAIVYWNKRLSGKATEKDSLCTSKMAAVTKICTDTLGEFTEDKMEIIEAVASCKERGIEIIFVSSKKSPVPEDITLPYGLTTNDAPQSSVLTGEDFRKYTDKERLENVDKIRVLGEAFSSDKLLLVETLREKGDVVAFLGQRTDEAPTLMRADVGIAMGRQSSEKAIESSDIMILNGGFAQIISMVDSGKCIYLNIQSFLQLVLITTISTTLINFIQTAAWGDASLTIVQSVCVNLAVLFLGGLALLTKPSVDKPVSFVPITCGRSIITAQMTRNILLQVLYQVICLVIIQTKGSGFVGSSQHMKTVVRNIFVICQFFNIFNARELQKKNFFRGTHRHKEFWVATTAFMVLHAAFVAGQDILGYGTRLNLKLWVGCVLVGVMSWLVDWLGKCISCMVHH
ncbi:hypothetical protein L1987_60469 [Smallanthus sonchifolius]|uniref:Uncharacterized protein n=1 Tax=Smallanthus sonchifolius TaxID=185202 RepID=A0ACB9D847_9ASTR|nr:hypothetical protein L1987_60469 [Smallanthus sonchifolius]